MKLHIETATGESSLTWAYVYPAFAVSVLLPGVVKMAGFSLELQVLPALFGLAIVLMAVYVRFVYPALTHIME
jgi:hypothetical protein